MKPFALSYFPLETKKHPWMYDCCTHDLPILGLTNEEDCVGESENDWNARDAIWILGAIYGTVRLAELLLNAGCSWNPVREYALEGDSGFRGVGPTSAELRIFLPGSDGYHFDEKDV